jgi:hypothetical protein
VTTLILISLVLLIVIQTIQLVYDGIVLKYNAEIFRRDADRLQRQLVEERKYNHELSIAFKRLLGEKCPGFAITSEGIEPLPAKWRELCYPAPKPEEPAP